MKMLKSLFILTSSGLPSFCYYNSTTSDNHLITPELLEGIFEWCKNEKLTPYLVFNRKLLSVKYRRILESFKHNKICFSAKDLTGVNDILVLSGEDFKRTKPDKEFKLSKVSNLVLRLHKSDLKNLKSIFFSLWGKFDRLNLILPDLDSYSQEDMDHYKNMIGEIEEFLSDPDISTFPEISFITDRIFLTDMRNCNAGTDHITVTSKGDLFICPGFSADPLSKIGSYSELPQLNIPNERLLELKYAPICSVCDCFHCKRCHWLNYKGTLEINTPTYQQCFSSHLEREASRKLMVSNENFPLNNSLAVALPYYDPLDVVESRRIDLPLDSFFPDQNKKVDNSLYVTLKELVSKFGTDLISDTLKTIYNEKDK